MQNNVVKIFNATAYTQSRCFECNLRMENMILFVEATCLWSSQSVWILRGNTVTVHTPARVSLPRARLFEHAKSVDQWLANLADLVCSHAIHEASVFFKLFLIFCICWILGNPTLSFVCIHHTLCIQACVLIIDTSCTVGPVIIEFR